MPKEKQNDREEIASGGSAATQVLPGAVGGVQRPSIGRIVHYRLTADDASRIMQWRHDRAANWGAVHHGAQAHWGNPVSEGDIVAMIITSPDSDDLIAGGQCILDGNDSYWVQGAHQGDDAGQWNWPPRV